MFTQLIAALGGASEVTSGLAQQLKRVAAAPATASTRNGGRHRTVAQDKRRAAKTRATRRAKRLRHH